MRVGEDYVARILAAQDSRGPNGQGMRSGDRHVLGHNRLALIDIEGGAQPMSDSTESVWISYNGEIYNFRELRTELEALGRTFRTRSDTEVIIQAWLQWGEECVGRFRGMFAFVLVDSAQNQALVARDPFGIKPVFIRRIDGGLVVASSLPAISKALPLPLSGRALALDLYLRYQYVPEPYTIYNEVERLGLATTLLVDLGTLRVTSRRYHDFNYRATWLPEWLAGHRAIEKAKRSVEAHTIADVPYGIFFSGGIDSTFVAAALKRRGVRTSAFTLGVRGGNEAEIELARQIADALGLDQQTEWTDADNEAELVAALRAFGEPFADSSALPCWLLSRRAAQSVRLVLSGDGGDEVFGGYGIYRSALEIERGLATPRRRGARFRRPLALAERGDAWDLRKLGRSVLELRLVVPDAERRELYQPAFQHRADQEDPIVASMSEEWFGESLVDFAQRIDFERYLPGSVLRKVDVTSMAFGLEVRVPLLDVEVLKAAKRLPRRIRVPDYARGRGVGKWVLRQEVAKLIGDSHAFAWKRGFGTPKQSMRRLQQALADRPVKSDAGIFRVLDHGKVRELHAAAISDGREDLCWTLGCLLLWAEENPEVEFC
jgi:asparagine synthase (glutamine-hydrolysing)